MTQKRRERNKIVPMFQRVPQTELVLFSESGTFQSISGSIKLLIFIEVVVVVVILWNNNNISCSMFHDFEKVYMVGLEERGLQTCALPQAASDIVRTYTFGKRGTLEQMPFLPCPSMACVFQSRGTRVEQTWNKV
jgi:hypothetical protein